MDRRSGSDNEINTKEMIDKDTLVHIKELPLPRLLADFGIYPVSSRGLYYTYLAGYRGEHNPSLSVFLNRDRRQWLYKDHATGEVGTNLDLLVRFGLFSDWLKAAAFLSSRYFGMGMASIRPYSSTTDFTTDIRTSHNTYSGQLHSISPIEGSPAENYIVNVRKIPIDIAEHYLSYGQYSFPPKERIFSGIIWQTCRGGWGVRWPADLGKGKGKGFIGAGGISFFPYENGIRSDECAVFEGVFDFLSFVFLKGNSCDSIVLNSVDNVKEAFNLLSSYRCIYGYLDRDEYGKDGWAKVTKQYGAKALDTSYEFEGFKDYNDFLKALKNNQ